MGLRFRRSFRLVPGIRLNVSEPGVSASIGARGAWFTIGRRGARATLGIPGTGLTYTEQSPWQRPKPHADGAPGIEVAELPREEIEISAAATPALRPPTTVDLDVPQADDEMHRDPRLLPIALVLVALVAAAAVLWALLV